jgi:hypothetical protein
MSQGTLEVTAPTVDDGEFDNREEHRLVGTQARFFYRAMRDGIRGLRGKAPLYPHPTRRPLIGSQVRSFLRAVNRAH